MTEPVNFDKLLDEQLQEQARFIRKAVVALVRRSAGSLNDITGHTLNALADHLEVDWDSIIRIAKKMQDGPNALTEDEITDILGDDCE